METKSKKTINKQPHKLKGYNQMFKKNDPLVEVSKKIMQENETRRQAQLLVNESLGIEDKKVLPRDLYEEYDAILAEAQKVAIEEGIDKVQLDEGEKRQKLVSKLRDKAVDDANKEFLDRSNNMNKKAGKSNAAEYKAKRAAALENISDPDPNKWEQRGRKFWLKKAKQYGDRQRKWASREVKESTDLEEGTLRSIVKKVANELPSRKRKIEDLNRRAMNKPTIKGWANAQKRVNAAVNEEQVDEEVVNRELKRHSKKYGFEAKSGQLAHGSGTYMTSPSRTRFMYSQKISNWIDANHKDAEVKKHFPNHDGNGGNLMLYHATKRNRMHPLSKHPNFPSDARGYLQYTKDKNSGKHLKENFLSEMGVRPTGGTTAARPAPRPMQQSPVAIGPGTSFQPRGAPTAQRTAREAAAKAPQGAAAVRANHGPHGEPRTQTGVVAPQAPQARQAAPQAQTQQPGAQAQQVTTAPRAQSKMGSYANVPGNVGSGGVAKGDYVKNNGKDYQSYGQGAQGSPSGPAPDRPSVSVGSSGNDTISKSPAAAPAKASAPTPRPRPQARAKPAAPARKETTGDIMNRMWVKESFESFLRNNFLKG